MTSMLVNMKQVGFEDGMAVKPFMECVLSKDFEDENVTPFLAISLIKQKPQKKES